ncbi:hypothetical protein DPMN_151294 [Dreissena polymorpha]|uniref:Uncharacterized protein n=1 Tax=Dreissena polymorpha TaxID=45954 RepID=A0A9D4J761_DREPO|nr:hypothetical protein DPMN_151294 [Dreissena polymorpha]
MTTNLKTMCDVRMSSKKESFITDIIVLDETQILLADNLNKKVKLLRNLEAVIDCSIPSSPWAMCQVTPKMVAVAVDQGVQWITVNYVESKVIPVAVDWGVKWIDVTYAMPEKDQTVPLNHTCRGIALHMDDMYISSGIALFKYRLVAENGERLYKDKTGPETGKTMFCKYI